jgi:hypothetical protein
MDVAQEPRAFCGATALRTPGEFFMKIRTLEYAVDDR